MGERSGSELDSVRGVEERRISGIERGECV